MKQKLRVGVAGAGWPGWQHMRGYQEQGEAEVVSLCDPNTERLHRIADEYGVPRRYASFDEMLEKESLDAVSICTPNAFHAEMAVAAMRAGAHVHCEKPMAVSSEGARMMAQVSSDTGRILMVGFQRRFGPEARHLKRFIDAGSMGGIYRARAVWVRRRGIPGLGGWFTTKKLSGGGALIDIGVHVLDLALWFMGFPEPTDVCASVGAKFGNRRRGTIDGDLWPASGEGTFDVDDFAFAHVNFGRECSLSLETSWAGHIKHDQMTIEIWGEDGGAKLWPLEIYTDHLDEPVDISPRLPDTDLHTLSVSHFVNVIKGREKLLCLPDEGMKGLELIERIYHAAGLAGPEVARRT